LDPYRPVKGKCKWWREQLHPEDEFDARLKSEQKRVVCTCFVEGHYWTVNVPELPSDCPDFRHCRYYIKEL
jgi:hypothetical protein